MTVIAICFVTICFLCTHELRISFAVLPRASEPSRYLRVLLAQTDYQGDCFSVVSLSLYCATTPRIDAYGSDYASLPRIIASSIPRPVPSHFIHQCCLAISGRRTSLGARPATRPAPSGSMSNTARCLGLPSRPAELRPQRPVEGTLNLRRGRAHPQDGGDGVTAGLSDFGPVDGIPP